MAVEALAWPSPPSSTDNSDGATTHYTLGCSFTVSTTQPCPGVEVRVSDSLLTPPGGHAVGIWTEAGSLVTLLEGITPNPGTTQRFLFPVPASLTAGTYVVGYYTNHYVARGGSPAGVATPSGSATAVNGRFTTGSAPGYPSGTLATTFYVSPLIGENAGGATPFTKDYSTAWNVQGSWSKDYASAWRVLAGFTRDYPGTWRVLNALTKDVATSWRVLGAWSRDYNSTWAVLNGTAFTKDYPASWRVLNAWSSDYVATWRVLAAWQRDHPVAWRVLNAWSTDYSASWRVTSSWTKDYATAWSVRQQWFVAYATAWQVLALEPLSRDYVVRWRVLSATPLPLLPADVVAVLGDHVMADLMPETTLAYWD